MAKITDIRIPVFPMGAGIPRVIYQIYINNESSSAIPEKIKANIYDIRRINSGWGYRLFGAQEISDYVLQHYGPEMLQAYHQIHPNYAAARADFFRYLLMYREGGVYLDLKSTTKRPLNEVIDSDDQYILVKWSNDPADSHANWGHHPILDAIGEEEYQQWHILAVAGHPFLRAVILKVLDNIARYDPIKNQVGKQGVLWLTGPIAYTLAIAPLTTQYRCRILRGQEQLGLVYSIFDDSKPEAHKHLFRHRYDALRHPVVRIHGLLQLRWFMRRLSSAMPSSIRRAILGAIGRQRPV